MCRRKHPHIQPGLVGLETLATGLGPAQGVLAFFDPVFDLGPAVIDLYRRAAVSWLPQNQSGGKAHPGAARTWPPPAETYASFSPGTARPLL